MNKVILLLTAVFGLSVAAFAADPSPSASASASGTPHHRTVKHHPHHKASPSPSAAASATPQ
jgi:hypothetical protein